jgi:predicted AAA+ superfamily ATPase
MNRIPRILQASILRNLRSNKVILLYGTRRVGKTYLLRSVLEEWKEPYVLLNGEDFEVQESFRKRTEAGLRNIVGNAPLLAIDEAQAIPEVGKALKLLIDTKPGLTILATGSSSLDLAGLSGEPLTGRQIPHLLFPIGQAELQQTPLQALQHLDERLVFGSYPEIFGLADVREKAAYLQQLVESYLLKDILAYSGIRHSDKIFSLLRLIAFQTGSEVSYQELSNRLGISKITVEHYLDLLSKVYILFKLPAYSSNQRNEVTKAAKWYFYDNGVRNAVVNDFRLPALRQDTGQLWESYIISERIKKLRYAGSLARFYFWRNYAQQEIDFIEEENGMLRAYEIKFTAPKRLKMPNSFQQAYPDTPLQCIHREAYWDFIV